MRKKLFAVGLLLLAGCRKAENFPTLASGSEAVTYDADPEKSTVGMRSDGKVLLVGIGARVTVAGDEPGEEHFEDFRPVKVMVRDGELSGVSGTIDRNKLRPAR